MFVVTVDFEAKPECAAQFCEAVVAQARNSMEREARCSRFDIGVDGENPSHYFLCELYADQPAFHSHLLPEHFISSTRRVRLGAHQEGTELGP